MKKIYFNWNRNPNTNNWINLSDPRYGLMKRLRRGFRVQLFLTFKCNLDCGYCTLKFADGEMPVSETMQLEDWQHVITDHFPHKIREVVLTGGEPMILPYYSELVNWMLSRGLFVTVYSNLMTSGGLKVNPSYRYRIASTYHHSASKEKFEKMLEKYREKYRVDIEEIGDTKKIEASHLKPYSSLEYTEECRGFFYTPEGRLFTNFNQMIRHYAKVNEQYAKESENLFRQERISNSLRIVPTSGV